MSRLSNLSVESLEKSIEGMRWELEQLDAKIAAHDKSIAGARVRADKIRAEIETVVGDLRNFAPMANEAQT